MKLKTYLRGLGLGLVVASLVTGVGSRQTMSDEQIKARAKELGMIESNTYLHQVDAAIETEETPEPAMETETSVETLESETIAELESKTTVETAVEETTAEESATEEITVETENTTEETVAESKESGETVAEETTAPEAESEPVEESQEQSGEDTTAPETVTFQIHSGDSSVSVAKRLAEAGLVGDAKAFDQYLCQNGYDKKIRTGTYEIQNDSSNEEIAKIITAGK